MLVDQLLLLCYQKWEGQLNLLRLDSFVLPYKKRKNPLLPLAALLTPQLLARIELKVPSSMCAAHTQWTFVKAWGYLKNIFLSFFFLCFLHISVQYQLAENTNVLSLSPNLEHFFDRILGANCSGCDPVRRSSGAAQMKVSALGTLIWRCALWLQTHI